MTVSQLTFCLLDVAAQLQGQQRGQHSQAHQHNMLFGDCRHAL